MSTNNQPFFDHDKLDAWFDGSAVCLIAVGTHGDPLDLSEEEAEAFLEKIEAAIKAAKTSL